VIVWWRWSSVAALLGLALLLGTGAAAAHSYLVSADPADGTTVASGPPRVTLTFNEPLQSSFDSLSVVGPDGNRWSTGDTQVNVSTGSGRQVHHRLPGALRRQPSGDRHHQFHAQHAG